MKKIFTVIIMIVSLACFSQNHTQSNKIPDKELNSYFSNFIKTKRPFLTLSGINKTGEGIQLIYNNIAVYDVSYKILLTANKDIYITDRSSHLANKFTKDLDYSERPPNNLDLAASTGNYQKISKGQKLYLEGEITVELQGNNFKFGNMRHGQFEFKNSNYVLKNVNSQSASVVDNSQQNKTIINKKSEEEVLKELKSKLDWKKQDIEPVEFNKHYFKIENVPYFDNGEVEYVIRPFKNFSGRNDVTSSIQSVFYKAIKSTNREQESSKTAFDESSNTSKIYFYITKVSFPFVESGYQCSISLNVSMSGEYNKPNHIDFNYSVPIVAKSNNYKKNMSKNQAFSSALDDLRLEIRHFIFKYDPIEIELLRIETDKKGKVNEIIFKRPTNFINIKKIKFIVLDESKLSVQNNSFAISEKIGECLFKGDITSEEIKCKVKGKNKKAFKKHINSKNKLIALSSF